MYHFVATCAPEPLDLSERLQIPGHIIQYLKDFQVETLRFLHRHLANRDFCILNDESGLGKCVATTVYLGAVAKNKNCLIIVQNDDDFVTGWQFHFEVLTKLSVGVLGSSSFDPPPNIIIAKWGTLRSTVIASKFNFDYIIVDNRGQMMNNNFCMSMLLSNYEHKVNLLISSNDVTSDLKLLHNSMRLGGRLEHQYEQFKFFESKYKLPDSKDVLNKTFDLEQYFLRREMISDYCKDFRLRRYRHQFEDELPLVDLDRYKISLELWHTISSSSSSQKSNDNINNLNPNSETATEELFNQALALDREILGNIDVRQSEASNYENYETSEDAIIMPPLLIDSESCSSNEAQEMIDIVNYEPVMHQSNQVEPDVYEFIDLSNDRGSEEYVSTVNKERSHPEGKTDKCQSNPRSLTNKSYNQKTTDNTINVIESQVSRKKTKVQYCKDTLDKKTPDEKEEPKNCTSKTVINENSKNINTFKTRQIHKNRKKKDDTGSTINEPVDDIHRKSHEAIGNSLKRRESKRIDDNYNESAKKAKATEDEELKPTRRRKNHQIKAGKGTLNKEKLSSKDTNISATKRAEVKQPKKRGKETENEKVQNNEISQKVTKSKQVVSKTPTRQLRQLRGDKIKRNKGKCSASPDKVNPSISLTSTTPLKNTGQKYRNSGNKSSNSSTSSDKRTKKVKDRAERNSRKEFFLTPTSRNTRGMQRQTRSSDTSKSKFMRSPLNLDSIRKPKKKKVVTVNSGRPKDKQRNVSESKETEKATSSMNSKTINEELEIDVRKKILNDENTNAKRLKVISAPEEVANVTDSAILPCSDTTDDMQCGQKVIANTHSDNIFLRPSTPMKVIRNSEAKILPTPSSFTDSEVVFVPPLEANKNQQIVILSSSTEDGSLSSQQSAQSRRTRALKQKKSIKRPITDCERLAELSTTPTFGELLAKQQRIHRNSPDIFSASTDLGLTCTQQHAAGGNDGVETFKGFKIFGSEVKQMQQQDAHNSNSKHSKSKQVLIRGRSCLNILEKMFDDPLTANVANKTQSKHSLKKTIDGKLVKRVTRCTQLIMPTLSNTANATQLQQVQNDNKSREKQSSNTTSQIIRGPMVDEEIFEITNNDAFGSVMRINSNGEISPVQTTTRTQQPTQHNKITNYLIGSTQLTPTETTLEERTLSKRVQTQLSGTLVRRSPKNRSTQSTKLTKWFQKNLTQNDFHLNADQQEIHVRKHTRSSIAKRLKRRCLELSFKN